MSDLQILSVNRWAMPLMAALDAAGGIRFAVAEMRLAAPRNSLSRAFDHVIAAGWVIRNPGHGHPLRPEYLLADAGRPIAGAAARVMHERAAQGLSPADLGRWTLPLVVGIAGEERRFGDLLTRLAPVTPRALSLAIKQGMAVSLIARDLRPASFPPLPLYVLTRRGGALAEALMA
ncbi:DNA-binding HxlR family transcriptional regulator [Sphingomonas zeicaulis]|uniref:winged helix-turn-helix transcriptional regulator n=1 Tax=Sphingomonas zeicaulis TaxID=1632740 RepID=UPI003D215CD1